MFKANPETHSGKVGWLLIFCASKYRMDVNICDGIYQVELVDDLDEPVFNRSDSRADASLAHQLAAETIQTSFR